MKCNQCKKEKRGMKIFIEVRGKIRKEILMCEPCVMDSGYVWTEGKRLESKVK